MNSSSTKDEFLQTFLQVRTGLSGHISRHQTMETHICGRTQSGVPDTCGNGEYDKHFNHPDDG